MPTLTQTATPHTTGSLVASKSNRYENLTITFGTNFANL
jgi:hypothetical protein